MEKSEIVVNAGVPQGSVLGPTLWSVYYDVVFGLQLPEGMTGVGFADDLARLVRARDLGELKYRANWALAEIGIWLSRRRLQLAPQKTEVVVLKGPRNRESVEFLLGGTRILPQKQFKYLGIVLDDLGTFGPYVKMDLEKAGKRMGALARLMPNIGGPTSGKRAVLGEVVQSTESQYHGVLRIKKYPEKLERAQRGVLLKVATAYRTSDHRDNPYRNAAGRAVIPL